MNYRHIYHAGSFSDVMKHLILIAIIEKMKEKPGAFTALDAFAGLGIYDLSSLEAKATMEYASGVGLFDKVNLDKAPIEFQIYKNIIDQLNANHIRYTNNKDGVNLYPGSPYIISKTLRENDSLVACELHKEDYLILKKNINAPVHNIDAYNAIKAFIPPKTSRGLIILDPAFEVKNEFNKIIDALKLIRKRFAAGVVMVWYPIKDSTNIHKFYNSLSETGYPEFIQIEFKIKNNDIAMNKCGVLIANPPEIKERLKLIMHFLCEVIYNSNAKAIVSIQVHGHPSA